MKCKYCKKYILENLKEFFCNNKTIWSHCEKMSNHIENQRKSLQSFSAFQKPVINTLVTGDKGQDY